jgi:hypothetical protein
MHPSYRVLFLIAAGLTVLHVSLLHTLIVLLGYLVFEWVDERVALKAKQKKIAKLYKVIFEWKPSNEDPAYEEQGGTTRIRLTGADQIVTARVADLVREIL